MSLGCAAGSCGKCCDPVFLPSTLTDVAARLADIGNPAHPRNPDSEANAEWMRDYLTPVDPQPEGFDGFDFTPTWGSAWTCRAFNPETRLCEHPNRPPICTGYPWYGQPPGEHGNQTGTYFLPGCSYQLDLPPQSRRPDARPLLPIVAVRSGAPVCRQMTPAVPSPA